jgi:hypothetical protein
MRNILIALVLLLSPVVVNQVAAEPMACKAMRLLGYHEWLWKFCELKLTTDFLPDYNDPYPGGGSW